MSEHVNYPHEEGRLHDCPACDEACHCLPESSGTTLCVFEGVHVRSVTRHPGIAGQYALTARVQYDDDDAASSVTFTSSAYGAPIVMTTPGNPAGVFVSSAVLDRIGRTLDEAWVRSFFAGAR